MELTQLIQARRSIHQFEDRPVDLELVKNWLNTALWVPNHKMTQPWRFVVVQGEGRRKLADVARAGAEKRERDPQKSKELGQRFYDRFLAVPLFVAVVMKEDPNPAVREEDYASTSCLIHNFSLLAWEQGVGMVWETYPLLHAPEFRAAFGVGPGERIVGSLHVGYPAKVPDAKPRIPVEQLLTVIDEA
ncbi:nitroreductase [Tumebacillus algifaecis]|uniref:Putative NAD(P)H nitroreductase n=1 Tax=Tumebacillus algifaecis TaxID=1214604 RepID=A0A223CWW4_9BACL|nr:nitroreductase [Tumebacillus algifaecis]ASS73694.1 nitroreductase [Tumebacillus algifaecis]